MKPRLSLPLAQWPVDDLQAWTRATTPPDSLFDAGYAASRLRPRSLQILLEVYGLWLHYLQRQGYLDTSGMGLVTPERLDGFVADQRSRGNNNGTLAKRLGNLHAALKLLAPGRDFSFILRPGGVPVSRALPHRPRRIDTVPTQVLFQHVLALHQAGLAGNAYAKGYAALRDAAVLGILVTLAPRVRSLSVMRLGRHIRKVEGVYLFTFEAEDMKEHDPLAYPATEALTKVLDDYLTLARPAMGGDGTDMLWMGTRNAAMDIRGLTKIPLRRTKEWLGVAHGPHWFRKCLTTTAVLQAPELAMDAAAVLGHSPQVSLHNYNMANAFAAAGRRNDRIAKLRHKTAGIAERAFAERLESRARR